MGTRRILDDRDDLFVDKIKRAYQTFGSCRKAAAVLGISYQTVRRILKAEGYELKPVGGGYMKGKHLNHPSRHYGCLAKWLREHPDERLPRSPKEISEITGCSQHAVRSYLYRRRKAASGTQEERSNSDRRSTQADQPASQSPPALSEQS